MELPPGTIGVCHPLGWMQLDVFTKWFQHFNENVKFSPDNLMLLVITLTRGMWRLLTWFEPMVLPEDLVL
jgi:hypothetical protein